MDNQNYRNMILAGILTVTILLGWDQAMRYFYPNAHAPKPAATASAAPTPAASDAVKKTREGGLTNPADIALEAKDIKTALASPARVRIEAPGLSGSINLVGGMLDDLSANRHTATLDAAQGAQRIYSPAGTPAQQFAQFGWTMGDGVPAIALPNAQTVWTAPAGAKLTPQSPVTISWNNGSGQTFTLTYAIDADYMLTVTQGISNAGPAPVAVKPVAQLNRTDKTAAVDSFNVHAGPFGAFDETVSFGPDYKDLAEANTVTNQGNPNWIGFTDIYWMSTLIPEKAGATSDFRSLGGGIFLANLFYPQVAIAPGQQSSRVTKLFAGAKETEVLDRYEAAGIPNFGLAIDWGWFRWFEKPIFWLLKSLFDAVGNFGVAIMLLTVIVKGIMFPVSQKQFASMAAMKAIQPKMKALQDRYKDDKQKQQQEIMALYKQEGVNPLAGCLPIFLQIPVFFALYKTLIVSVEMRHQPFALWIKDLSAPDPLHILNLFGLLPFDVPSFLGIGVLALLLGITMWLQFKLNPAQMDPVQQQVFAIMPWMMMFVMAPFAAGLLLYWITNNLLTIAQQAYLYSKHPALKVQADKDAEDAKRAQARGK
ncbi:MULTISPECIES: membrane protein insertase YidC [unclassified Novosphingobium]|uniref:membrane protein insertase YidC n=1 Tax=unclassified Novosphingobium TaxID=2644732 RepID=UPI000EE98272|nr:MULTISPECIES: membrane protein insertase YidC [unclassified Novosphingobium]HCF24705.1 membrane protein insertase YidC [Novosphingobium sp.]HQV02086.1 membrane protein insertase YidC [Novosphingobium sp.]